MPKSFLGLISIVKDKNLPKRGAPFAYENRIRQFPTFEENALFRPTKCRVNNKKSETIEQFRLRLTYSSTLPNRKKSFLSSSLEFFLPTLLKSFASGKSRRYRKEFPNRFRMRDYLEKCFKGSQSHAFHHWFPDQLGCKRHYKRDVRVSHLIPSLMQSERLNGRSYYFWLCPSLTFLVTDKVDLFPLLGDLATNLYLSRWRVPTEWMAWRIRIPTTISRRV